MAANNETGVIQPLSKVAELARTYGALFHSDMVQFLGKAECDLNRTNLDFASFSAHKIGGPSGIGVLWCRSGHQLESLLKGGGQEQGRRSGTENLAGIIGFGMAVELTDHTQLQQQGQWRDGAEAQIKTACPEVRVIGAQAQRLANTSALYLPFVSAQTAVMKLDLAGFCISAGSACSSGKVKKSHVIEAMGYADAASNVIRLSGGWNTDKEDWEGVADAIIALYKQGR